jgi:hypothetical protein
VVVVDRLEELSTVAGRLMWCAGCVTEVAYEVAS